MDETFRARVDKVFGSLNPSSSSSLRSLWSLSDEEVEKKEWNRDKGENSRDENPCSSSFDGLFPIQQKTSEKNSRRSGLESESLDWEDNREEEWEIRSSIGLDSTLDNEEEEDEHDKIALGIENVDAGDRLYMKDIADYGPYLNSHNILPESFKDRARDSRANLFAATIRLKEDEEAFGALDSLPEAGKGVPVVVDSSLTEDGGNLKSILRSREYQSDIKSQKRVRFNHACEDTCKEEYGGTQDTVMMMNCSVETITDGNGTSFPPQDSPGVPDYLQNPAKYKRYSFDSSSEVDEMSNQKAYIDFLGTIKSPMSAEELPCADLPKSVKFIPKRKAAADATTMEDNCNMKQGQKNISKEPMRRTTGSATGIAFTVVQENEACTMEEDDPKMTIETRSGNSQKTGRKYRSKVRPYDS